MKKLLGLVLLSGVTLAGCAPTLNQAYLMDTDWKMDPAQMGGGEEVPMDSFVEFDEDTMNVSFEMREDMDLSEEDKETADMLAPMLETMKFEVEYELEGDQLTIKDPNGGDPVVHEISFDDDNNIMSRIIEPDGIEGVDDENRWLIQYDKDAEAAEEEVSAAVEEK